MGHGRIDQQQPKAAEQQHRREADPLDIGPDDQGGGDHREGGLEHEEGLFGDGPVQAGAGHAGQEALGQVADPQARAAEGQAVAHGQPQDRAEAGDGHAMGHDRQHVLGPHQPAIEQGQARQGHEQDQGRGAQNPGSVAVIGGGGRALGPGDTAEHGRAEAEGRPLKAVADQCHWPRPRRRPQGRFRGYSRAGGDCSRREQSCANIGRRL